MPRPRLRPGEHGNIAARRDGTGWTASAYYRRADGQVRRASATGRSKSEAQSGVRAKVAQKVGDLAGLGLTAESTVAELAALHLTAEEARRPPLAPNTIREIRNTIGLHINPRLGALTLRECTAPFVDAAVTALAAEHPPQAKKMRWVLSSMFKRAVRLGAVTASPVVAVQAVRVEHPPPRALTLEDLAAVRAAVRAQPVPRTNRRAGASAADLLEYLIATGCRAAEPLGLHWEDVHLDASIPWVHVHRQVVRVEGEGLRITPTKEQDRRALPLPPFAVAMLARLRAEATGALVFPNRDGGPRDPRAMRRIWDKALEGTEWEWVTLKVLRKTVATYLSEVEGSVRAAAQLGHADDRVTRAHYIEAKVVPLELGRIVDLGETPLS
jgi:integrase